MKHTDAIWHDRKRNFLGLPWTFTIYELSPNRIFIDTGILSQRSDEVRLYRITDVVLTRNLWQRIIGTGTIHVDSADVNMKNFLIKNIKDSVRIKEQLSEMVDTARRENRVYAREDMNGMGGDVDGPEFGPDFGPDHPF